LRNNIEFLLAHLLDLQSLAVWQTIGVVIGEEAEMYVPAAPHQ